MDELSESLILAEDFFEMTEIPNDFSYSLPESRKIEKNITAPHMIDVLDLNFSYDEEAVLSDINISIDKGTFLGIAGPSGCGKSSFIKTVKNCDNIIVINHGKIVQSGRYDELLEKDGIFSDMCYGRLK